MAYSGSMPNIEDPPCLGCEHYEHCKQEGMACSMFVKYSAKGGRGWPDWVRLMGAPEPSRKQYEHLFSGEEDSNDDRPQ